MNTNFFNASCACGRKSVCDRPVSYPDRTRHAGAKRYERETLLAYDDFLPAAFLEQGLLLERYVDFHSFIFPHTPDALITPVVTTWSWPPNPIQKPNLKFSSPTSQTALLVRF